MFFFKRRTADAREPPVPDFEAENKSKFGGKYKMRNYECDPVKIGQRLKEVRTKGNRAMTQLGFAEEVGTFVSNISKIEQGQRYPGVELLFDYMNYFEVDANYLLGCETENGAVEKSIDYKLSKLPLEAQKYLKHVFMEMIKNYPAE